MARLTRAVPAPQLGLQTTCVALTRLASLATAPKRQRRRLGSGRRSKPLPATVTCVPPSAGPLSGWMDRSVGCS